MKMRKSNFIIAIGFALIYSISITQGNAQQSSIDNGLAYLRSTQNSDGSWGGTATSLNTVLQTTATTARTLQLLGVTDTSLSNALGFLSAQTPSTVNDLAQQLEVLAVSGTEVTPLVASVKSAQRADGGWGIDLEKTFSSEVVDTLAAVQALKAANALDSVASSAMLEYLLASQNPDGGWGITPGQPSQVYDTALALLALKDHQRAFDLTAPLTAAGRFLASQQNPDGSIGGSVFETALALQALVRHLFDPTRRDAAVSYLSSAQGANGSWQEDAFSTALALRALRDAESASQPQLQAIALSRVVDGAPQPATSYQAFETVVIDVTMADPHVGLEGIVQDSTGAVFSTRMEGGELFFDTQSLAQGTYTLTLRAIDPATGVILDQQTATFTLEATVALRDALLEVTPQFTHAGRTETVTVALGLTNGSNTAASLTLEHELKSPTGAILSSGVTPLSLSPEVTFTNVTLATFGHTFTESGDYPLQARVFHGAELLATASSTVSAAPIVRIEPNKTLTPQSVPPDGDRRIRIHIHLQGVEQKP